MPTINAGTSQTITIPVNRTYRISTAGEAYVDCVSGIHGSGYTSIRLKDLRTEQIYGPSTIPIVLNVRAVTGAATAADITNEGLVSTAVDASGNVTGLVGPGGEIAITNKAFTQKYTMPVIERFNAITDWTVANSGGTAVAKASGVIGVNCINLQTPATAGQNTYITQDQTIDLSAANGVWVLLRNRYRTVATGVGLTTYLANGAGLTVGTGGRFQCTTVPSAGAVSVQPHWIPKTSFTTLDGTPTFASPILSWRFRLDSVATQARDVDMCGVILGKQKPTIIVTFDDGWDSSYSIGHVQARKREIPLTHYLIGNLLDRTDINYITVAQALEMAAQGDYIGLHGASPWDANLALPESDKADLVSKLGDISDYAHAAYPEGKIGDQELWQQTEQVLAGIGVKTGRLAGVTGEPTLCGYGDSYALTAYPMNNTITLAQAQAAVDTAISSGGTVIFYGHKIGATADALTWVTSDYTSLLDYIVTKRNSGDVEVKTISDWYDQFANQV